jgi:ribonuclease T1
MLLVRRVLACIALFAVLVTGCGRSSGVSTGSPVGSSGLPTIAASDLPFEARQSLKLVDAGGPFPYPQDGSVFANREGSLPRQPNGTYHEYTVEKPGATDRGPWRLVVGGGWTFWTEDHYTSFREVVKGSR